MVEATRPLHSGQLRADIVTIICLYTKIVKISISYHTIPIFIIYGMHIEYISKEIAKIFGKKDCFFYLCIIAN
jgi:hypothetical protein